MKVKILVVISIAFMYSCSSFNYSSEDITGTYTQMREDGVKSFIDLTIYRTGFALVDVADYTKRHQDVGKHMCCDTITFGTWKIDNKHGLLSLSTPQLSDTYVKGFVQEETKPNTDSVHFFISNPIEKEMPKKHQYIFYVIDLYSVGDFGNDLINNHYDTNNIVVANPNRVSIQNFSIITYITPEYDARNIAVNPIKTVPYKVKERGANSFKIDIPELSFQYITYLRLKEHLVKIVNKNELIWDGIKYERK